MKFPKTAYEQEREFGPILLLVTASNAAMRPVTVDFDVRDSGPMADIWCNITVIPPFLTGCNAATKTHGQINSRLLRVSQVGLKYNDLRIQMDWYLALSK